MSKPLSLEPTWTIGIPLMLFFTVFVFMPIVLLFFVSLHADTSLTIFSFSQYLKFFSSAFNRGVLLGTLLLGLSSTGIALVIGYPLAWIYTYSSATRQRFLMIVILLPLLTSSVVRTFAWVVILGRQGIINELLHYLGWTDGPLKLLYTPSAVAVALAQIELPLMILPLTTAMGNINDNLHQASLALGAGHWRTFFQITLPLSMPGLLAGCVLVFAGSVSAFVTQTLVGGGQKIYMPFYMYQQAIEDNNYPFAATIAILLLLCVAAVTYAMNVVGRRSKGYIHA
jgi:putative spermidine/putrescine transport system permease protein